MEDQPFQISSRVSNLHASTVHLGIQINCRFVLTAFYYVSRARRGRYILPSSYKVARVTSHGAVVC